MNDDDVLLERLGAALERPVPPEPAGRAEAVRAAAVRAAAAREEGTEHVTTVPAAATTRRAWILSTAAAAVGAVAGASALEAVDDDPAAGPPTEAMRWSVDDAGLTASGRTIDHTWGVELLLDATGFEVGTAYRVAVLGASGARVDAGGFVGSAVPMRCRCNAPLLRADAVAIEVSDPAGRVVARGEFA